MLIGLPEAKPRGCVFSKMGGDSFGGVCRDQRGVCLDQRGVCLDQKGCVHRSIP